MAGLMTHTHPQKIKIYRPKGDINAVGIDMGDGKQPAYMPTCEEYAFETLKKLAAIVNDKKATKK